MATEGFVQRSPSRAASFRLRLRNHRVYEAIPHTMPEESKANWVAWDGIGTLLKGFLRCL